MKSHIKRLDHLAHAPENSEPWKVDALMDSIALVSASWGLRAVGDQRGDECSPEFEAAWEAFCKALDATGEVAS